MIKSAARLLKSPPGGDIAPLAENPAYTAALAEVEKIQARRDETASRRAAAVARKRQTTTANPLAKAAALIAGARVTSTDPDQELAACAAEDEALAAAMGVAVERLENAVGQASFEAATRLRPLHDQALRDALAAMDGLAAAVETINGLRAKLSAAGLKPRSDILPVPLPSAVPLLLQQRDSFRRWAVAEGII